ncbi:MAG: hypothetical protein ACTS7D_01480 [Candidatus Hodgkinia cicadicola]
MHLCTGSKDGDFGCSPLAPAVTLDPKVVKESLPEVQRRFEECPKLFIKICVALLRCTNLLKEVYVTTISNQMWGSAAMWWQNIRGLNLDWEHFQKEFLLRFDSDAVKASVHKKLLMENQPTGMRAGAFVIQKFQLFKRIPPDQNCDEAVPFIIELLNDKIRLLVKVSHPKTFEDLREIIRQLEDESTSKNRTKIEEGSVSKCYSVADQDIWETSVRRWKTKAGPFWIGEGCFRESRISSET